MCPNHVTPDLFALLHGHKTLFNDHANNLHKSFPLYSTFTRQQHDTPHTKKDSEREERELDHT